MRVIDNDRFVSHRAFAAMLLDSIQWRHHGLGMLQGYITENYNPEIRLHIWSPLLVKPGIETNGDIHDHRFDMVSHVLYGEIAHEIVTPWRHPEGEYAMMEMTHARAAADTLYNGPTKPLPGLFGTDRATFVIKAGESYRFPERRFHRSPLRYDLAISVIEKWNQSAAPARMLHRIDSPPVDAFGHVPDAALITKVLDQAAKALRNRR